MPRQIAIRLGTEGKAQVVADLDSIGQTGDAAFNRAARAAARFADDAQAAVEKASRAASKLDVLRPGLNPTKLDAAAGVRDTVGKSAESSAAVFEAAYAKMEARAVALRAAIDPAFGAQQRFDKEIGEARALISAGAISLDEYVAKLRQEQAALDAVTVGHGKAGGAAGAQRAAMQGLSYQAQDAFTQLSMGANVLQVLAIQGGQAAGQFSNLEGKAGNVARFMIGPWGLAITAGALVLGPLLGKLINTNSELDDAVDKLKKNADATETNRRAQEVFANSAEGVAAAIREQAVALDKAADSDRSAAERARDGAKANLEHELAVRRTTLALLEQARIGAQILRGPGISSERGIGVAQSAADAQVARLTGAAAEAQAAVDTAKRNLLGTGVALAQEAAKRESDPIERINAAYKRKADAATNAATAAARAGRDVQASLSAELVGIEKARLAAVKAEQDKQQASTETARQYGREVTSSQAVAIARAAGLQVNSADRSTRRQTELYNAWIAQGRPAANPVAKPGTSAHERGNALDIQFEAGVTAKKIRDAFAAEGVRLTKVFAETGHWHIEWAKTAEQRTAETDATKTARDLTAANKQLNDDLVEVVKLYDPARAAANEYAKELAKIQALVAGGKLTPGEGRAYSFDAMMAEDKRRAEADEKRFTTLFGSRDVMGEENEKGLGDVRQRSQQWQEEQARRQQIQENGVRNVASLYRDLMTGGVSSIVERFRKSSLDAVAEILAKWTIGQLAKSSSGFLQSIGSILGGGAAKTGASAPKNAAGTEYWSGGMSLVGENGMELVNMPRGSRVTPAAETRRLLAGNDNRPSTIHATFHQTYKFEGVAVTQEQFAMGLSATRNDTLAKIADINRRRG